ncbi:branched-chain amino acid ABC transporter substrate-binding protein [Sorangium cellulosum]|uniref:Branched-chain amino acid ABC transporter substrate-binding protein n=1 Tax=Sorangium cellulosum TaxID=56 RepID=A0A4P2PVH3_SORCE|nr:ABC transporter substrate-binding protein [Sorangium cellulosum]AUX20714.1 branched-chain amino acid ABC transporter substrate-binding protein [Sorangium cellulosum]
MGLAGRARRARRVTAGLLAGLVSLLSASCASEAPGTPEDAVVIGGLLPFTGGESAIGRNLEQAMLLAVEDVNAAGGLDGKPFALVSRDSHSSSERGFNQLIELLYTDRVAYLIGPEENDLAREIAQDVKALDRLHMLPGYAAPSVERSETRGGWIRLAPSPFALGCALAKIAVREGVDSANSLAARDDYNASVSSEFTTHIASLGGRVLPSVTFTSGQSTYREKIGVAFGANAEGTLLAAYPATASTIVTEWAVSGRPGTWLLGPALRTEVLLANIPEGSLDGYSGVSPSLSLRSECRVVDDAQGTVDCATGNAAAFIRRFSRRWSGEVPFPAAHFYYDGVVLIAMGLVYAQATSGDIPTSGRALQEIIRELSSPDHEVASWRDLKTAMERLRAGTPLRYVGAAAEYELDEYGASKHHFLQEWTIDGDAFVDLAPIAVSCPAWR